MWKKIKFLGGVLLCLSFFMIFAVCSQVYADPEKITSDTVITKDNIYEVLEYLGIDPDNYIESDEIEPTVTTVGELENVLQQLKQVPNNIFKEINSSGAIRNDIGLFADVGTILLTESVDYDGFIIDYEVYADFVDTRFTGVYSPDCYIDSIDVGVFYKIDSKTLKASYTSSRVTLDAKLKVGGYIGIGPGSIKVNSLNVNTILYWYADDVL